MTLSDTVITEPWRDAALPTAERVEALVGALTLEEKIAQLYGIWIAASNDGAEVAPNQNEMTEDIDLDVFLPLGLGQLTRTYGTIPVDPAAGAVSLLRTQQRIVAESRLGIPALAHEECLAGFAAWGATAYPVPLSWGASWSPEIVERVGAQIGADMRKMGVHQGLAPVLDVVRDARWGRVEETIGEDPYLVGTTATAYIKGLESAGIVATLKHFAGYSTSKAGRNLAPVSIGPRELADVILPPFEMAIRESGVRSVMNSYTDIDGVPSAADESLLTGLLRDTWGFDGTVVADYFAIAFLLTQHGVAEDWTDAAHQALQAGIDVELPGRKTFGPGLVAAVRDGVVPEALVDRALRRVLSQKIELGLLDGDAGFVPDVLAGDETASADDVRGTVDLDPAENRALARELAERAIVLLSNDGTLPLNAPRRIALVGPNGDDPFAVLGCYSFPLHVGIHHPDFGAGIVLPTLLESLREEFPDAEITYVQGTSVDGGERDFAEALASVQGADVAIVALGDRAGLFGRGTSGEGCDASDLSLPGAQQQLLDAVIATGIPTVATLLAGRPYALGSAATEAAAIVEAFFAGEEGTPAVAGVLSGRINPSGRLPVSVPSNPGAQPSTYLAPPLARKTGVSNIDTTPAFAFGHGVGYTTFSWTDAAADAGEIAVDGSVTVSLTVRNTGDRAGAEVVQLYVNDPVASTVRPVQRLVSYARLELEPGEGAKVSFRVPADLTSFTSRDGRRIVEPGDIVFGLGRSSADIVSAQVVRLTGSERQVDHTRELHASVTVLPDA
ncbi:glycoside hydrolase family 3 N-terminal domain-containing protein [Microbacterium ulmi]|uniref:Glycosyl hydrolase n=1 Tax=Microbacterium ulmi TaxID=179095 RepID=A0A7Y2M145_9MICO|nr:glycoside hydrolase family 3 N-terminal domain-containing protein [Microbacterium ulmi]NNH04575.1 glycosyl hydrolase [Microbacterium ulmi]